MLLVLSIIENAFCFRAICTRMPRVRRTHTLFPSLYNLLRLSVFMYWNRLQCILEPDTSESTLQSFLDEQTLGKRHTCEDVSLWENQDSPPDSSPGNLCEVDTDSEAPLPYHAFKHSILIWLGLVLFFVLTCFRWNKWPIVIPLHNKVSFTYAWCPLFVAAHLHFPEICAF